MRGMTSTYGSATMRVVSAVVVYEAGWRGASVRRRNALLLPGNSNNHAYPLSGQNTDDLERRPRDLETARQFTLVVEISTVKNGGGDSAQRQQQLVPR